MRIIPLFLLFLFFISCSSLPETTVSSGPEEQAASRRFEQATRLLQQEKPEEAKILFEQSYALYTGIDHAEGKIRSALGLARVFHLSGNSPEAGKWEQLASDWVSGWNPESEQYLILYRVENYYKKGLTDSVRSLTGRQLKTISATVQWQLKGYQILATTNPQDRLLLLEKTEDVLSSEGSGEKGLRQDQSALGFCWYSVGYGWFAEGKYENAQQAYGKAADCYRRTEDTFALADAVFGEAQSLRKLNRLKEAEVAYFRAWEMYEQSGKSLQGDNALFSGLELKIRHSPFAKAELEQLMRSTRDSALQNKIRSRYFGQQ